MTVSVSHFVCLKVSVSQSVHVYDSFCQSVSSCVRKFLSVSQFMCLEFLSVSQFMCMTVSFSQSVHVVESFCQSVSSCV